MTSYAHSLGLTSGWYGNNCICSDPKTNEPKFYKGDVKAMRAFGFDSDRRQASNRRPLLRSTYLPLNAPVAC